LRAQDLLDSYPGAPPQPTEADPFVQVDWVFAQRRAKVPSKDGKDSYDSTLKWVKAFLASTRGTSPRPLKELLSVTVLIEFKNWLLGPNCRLGSHSRTQVMSCFRGSLREAVTLDLIDEFANATTPSATRETQLHNVYSPKELASIMEVVRREHAFTLSTLKPYERTGVGRDPQMLAPGARQTRGLRGYGWKPADNMRWYFENRLNCVPTDWTSPDAQQHRYFLLNAGLKHGGLRAMYRSWGLTVSVDEHVLAPLVVQLQYLTGLNPYSLITLKVDCLREHALVGTKYIAYRKLRSGGDKELLLDLLKGVGNSLDIGDYVEQSANLAPEQAVLIERCIQRVLALTASIRERAGSDLLSQLFIYESSGATTFGDIKHFDLDKVNQWCRNRVEKENLRADDGAKLSFNLVRFRPTRLTQMAMEGKDFFEIQLFAGHANVSTTVDYIEERMFGLISDKTVVKALDVIWANKAEYEATCEAQHVRTEGAIEAIETLMCKCKNVLDPPEHVRKATNYVEGDGCTSFNMCLFCENNLVTEVDLPYLAYYRAQVRQALSPQSRTNVPNRKLYERTHSVLDQILDPESSEFTPEQIERALTLSLDVDLVIDSLVYVAMEDL
jgi:integrase